jgi:signal transduction histidine kinase
LATLVAAEHSGGQFDRVALERLLRQSSAQLGVVMEVHRTTPKGSEIIESTGFQEALAPPPNGERRIDESLLESHNLIVVDQPVWLADPSGRGTVVLRIIAEPSPWTSEHDWPETLTVAAGAGLVLLVLGGLMIEILVLRPMRAVEKAAILVAEGNLYATVPEDGPAEFRALAAAFNGMTEALQDQRDQIERQAERLQRSKQLAAMGSLSAGVAHEVGNPLAAVLGYTEILLDPRAEPPLSEEQRGLLERIQTQTQRIQTIVGQLLDYSRPTQTSAIEFSPHEHLSETIALLRADPRAEGIQIDLTGSESAAAHADPSLLEQVMLNLLLNASRAAKEGGAEPPRVRVRITPSAADGEGVVVEVQDNGPGIAEEDRPRLFEPFFTTSAAGAGTGLGLAISQGLAESMGGTLDCLDAEARPPLDPGGPHGAVFRLELPGAQPSPKSE